MLSPDAPVVTFGQKISLHPPPHLPCTSYHIQMTLITPNIQVSLKISNKHNDPPAVTTPHQYVNNPIIKYRTSKNFNILA